MTDSDLCMYMIENESCCYSSVTFYQKMFTCADIIFNGVVEKEWSNRFLADCVLSYFVHGWVAFRFCELNNTENCKVIPCVIPISCLTWEYEKELTTKALQVPNVSTSGNYSKNHQHTRVFVYRFSGSSLYAYSSGILSSTLLAYRRLLNVRKYNIIQQNRSLQSHMCLSQVIQKEKLVSNKEFTQDTYWETLDQPWHTCTTDTACDNSKDMNKIIESYCDSSEFHNKYESCVGLPPNTVMSDPMANRRIIYADESTYENIFFKQLSDIFQLPVNRQNNVEKRQHNNKSNQMYSSNNEATGLKKNLEFNLLSKKI
jgi:hypothetical protein